LTAALQTKRNLSTFFTYLIFPGQTKEKRGLYPQYCLDTLSENPVRDLEPVVSETEGS